MFKSFCKSWKNQHCEKGSVATIFAFTLIPMLAVFGLAVDYSRSVEAKSYIQNEVDAAALYAVQLGPDADPMIRLASLKDNIEARFGSIEGEPGVKNVHITASWVSPVDLQVNVSAAIPNSMLNGLPGFSDYMTVNTTSVARIYEPRWVYKEPEVLYLEPEAGDYNRIYVYCFNPEEKDAPNKGRTQMIPIADNGGTKYTFTMPRCEHNETLSYRLMNVRNSRTNKKNWDNPNVERYDHYSDTIRVAGREVYDFKGLEILETVYCHTLAECKPVNQGGILPSGKERNPQRATQPCRPGAYMYYGWEDRPPGLGWTDRDYDDIRIIVECPVIEASEQRVVRLIQ